MQVKFPGVEFLETAPKFRKRKKTSSSFVYVPSGILRHIRAVTAKKYTKKCNAHAELLFWLFLKTYFWFSSPLLKLPILFGWQRQPSRCGRIETSGVVLRTFNAFIHLHVFLTLRHVNLPGRSRMITITNARKGGRLSVVLSAQHEPLT